MSWPRLPLAPVPSITSVLTARIRSRPPSAAAASLIICCSGVVCVHAVTAAAANNTSQVVRFIFPLLVRLKSTLPPTAVGLELSRDHRTHADDLHNHLFVLRTIKMMAVGWVEHVTARLHRNHLIGVGTVTFRAERHPPCTLKYCDVPILAMKVRSADTAGRECVTDHVYPWLGWIAKEDNLTGPFERPQIFRLCRDKPMPVRFRGLPGGQRNGKKARSEDEADPFDRAGACHGRFLCNVVWT